MSVGMGWEGVVGDVDKQLNLQRIAIWFLQASLSVDQDM